MLSSETGQEMHIPPPRIANPDPSVFDVICSWKNKKAKIAVNTASKLMRSVPCTPDVKLRPTKYRAGPTTEPAKSQPASTHGCRKVSPPALIAHGSRASPAARYVHAAAVNGGTA